MREAVLVLDVVDRGAGATDFRRRGYCGAQRQDLLVADLELGEFCRAAFGPGQKSERIGLGVDRKSGVADKSVSVRVEFGGSRNITKQNRVRQKKISVI